MRGKVNRMSELEKYKNEILIIFGTTGDIKEVEEWIHDKWLDYSMTDETEEELYNWLKYKKQSYGCKDNNEFVWRCENCKTECENRSKNLVYIK